MSNFGPVPDNLKRSRQKVFKAGKIVVSNLSRIIDVEISDMNASGAWVRIPTNVDIPASFELFVVSNGLLYPATPRWHQGEWIGVEFVGEPHPLSRRTRSKP